MNRNALLESLIRRSRGSSPVPPTPSIPTDYVFYAPFTEDLDDESQYQRTMTLTSGTATYDTVDGIASVLVPGNSVLKSNDFSGITSGDHGHAISVWQKFATSPSTGAYIVFGIGNAGSSYGDFAVAIYGGNRYFFTTCNYDGSRIGTIDTNWHHLLLNHDSTTGAYDFYIDGVLVDSKTNSSGLNLSSTGYIFFNGGMKSNGSTDVVMSTATRYRNARVYDRALTSSEIALLAGELTPVKSVMFDDQTASFYGTMQNSKTLETDPSGCTFVLTSGSLPSGVTLSSAGVLTYDGSGISTTQTVQVTVTASKTGYVSETATISIAMTAAGGSIPTDYDWYTPYTMDYTDVKGGYTGSPNQPSAFSIATDNSKFGTGYLQVRKTTADSVGIEYSGTKGVLFQYGTGSFAVSFWSRTPDWNSYGQLFLGNKPGDGSDGFVIFKDHSNTMDVRIGTYYPGGSLNGPNAYLETDWHHHVFQRKSGGTWEWYTDGVLGQSGTGATGSATTSTQNFKVGGGTNWSKQAYFDLAQLRIYGRDLTSAEILALANEF